jgi:hypothetical protein
MYGSNMERPPVFPGGWHCRSDAARSQTSFCEKEGLGKPRFRYPRSGPAFHFSRVSVMTLVDSTAPWRRPEIPETSS